MNNDILFILKKYNILINKMDYKINLITDEIILNNKVIHTLENETNFSRKNKKWIFYACLTFLMLVSSIFIMINPITLIKLTTFQNFLLSSIVNGISLFFSGNMLFQTIKSYPPKIDLESLELLKRKNEKLLDQKKALIFEKQEMIEMKKNMDELSKYYLNEYKKTYPIEYDICKNKCMKKRKN